MSSRATEATRGPLPRTRRCLRRLTAGTTAGGVILLGAPLVGQHVDPAGVAGPTAGTDRSTSLALVSAHQRSHRWPGHPGRRIRHYTVKRGDTATGLAVRFHAWTDELLALNHLSRRATLYAGHRLAIPVVVAAARRARQHRAHPHRAHHHAAHHHAAHHHAAHHHAAHHKARHHRARHHKARHHKAQHAARLRNRHGWRHADASRATVRRVVARTARRHGVHPRLALAIAWQESGWQQRRVSSAGAVGVMQVMPATGRWMSFLVGHRLHLRRLHHNVTAGVVLIKILRSEVGARRAAAGYYQGLTSVRRYGMYPSTRHYVASVMAIRKRLGNGWNPA